MTISIEEFYQNNQIDDKFDEVFYSEQYPETKDFYQPHCKANGIDEKHRLYFHYINYGKKLNFKKYPTYIYVKPTQGLCNRLLLLDSVHAFAIEHNFNQIYLCWSHSSGFSHESFESLFNHKLLPANWFIIDEREYEQAQKKYLNLDQTFEQDTGTLSYIHTNEHETLEYIKTHSFTYESYASLDWAFNLNLKYRYDFIKTFIKPSDRLQNIINNIEVDYNNIGIHIRRGDAIKSPWSSFFQQSSDDYFDHIINQIDNKFYLSTDSKDIHQDIINKYQNKIIYNTAKKFVDDNITIHDTKPHQEDAVIDLFCLSKTHKIFGTNWSTFSLVASVINNSRLEIANSKSDYHVPDMSAIVAVKDRFSVLKSTINSWLIHPEIKEIIIVDWTSKDLDKNDLLMMDKRIKVITVEGEDFFHLSRAYNKAIENTTFEHIIKLDVDYFLNPYMHLNQWLCFNRETEFMTGCWGFKDIDNGCGFLEYLNGFMAIAKKHLISVGSYAGNKHGYGYDDCHLYKRLEGIGLRRRTINVGANYIPILHVPHSDFKRSQYYKNKDIRASTILNKEDEK